MGVPKASFCTNTRYFKCWIVQPCTCLFKKMLNITICFNMPICYLLTNILINPKSLLLKNTTPISAYTRGHETRLDESTSRYKPSYTHGIYTILSPIFSGLHLQYTWLGCEGSGVRNQDKTS